MKAIRLLYLTAETCPTFRADVAVLFGKYLPALGVATDVVAGCAPEVNLPVKWAGGEALLCRTNGGAFTRRTKVFVHGVFRLVASDGNRYSAIQVRDMPVLAAVGLLVAYWKRLPFVYWMSFPMPEGQIALARERGLSAGLMKFVYPLVSGHVGRFLLGNWVLQRATHVFVQSPRMKENLVKLGVAAARMTAVPMGVDLRAMATSDLRPAADARMVGRRVVGYLGTLDRVRRIETLFEMLALVRSAVPDALLLLVGDTEEAGHRRWLEQRAVEAGVADHVVWTGWRPAVQAWSLMLDAEVAVSPIVRGALLDCSSPTKIPEYLALGLPVVCNDVPDQEAVIRDSSAGLCVPYTAKDFAAAVVTLFGMDLDARHRMAAAGRRYVGVARDYSRIAVDVASTYQRILT